MSEDNLKNYSVYKKDGIICCVFNPDCIIDLEMMKVVIGKRIETAEGKLYPILIDARDVKYWTLEARKYGLSKEAHQCAKAYGVLLNSSISTTIVTWALKMFPHVLPQRIFTNEQEAIQWLQKFVDKEQGLKQSKPLLVF